MDRQVIDQKLESLRRCLKRIEAKCPAQAEALLADLDLQDILSLNLSRAVQLAVDMGAHIIAQLEVPAPGTMGQTFDLLADQGVLDRALAQQLKKAVGFRNIAVHNYDAINWYMVHSIASDHLSDFSRFATAVVTWMDTH
ncbi:MAG: DUF86 domain-containing protein [Simplicispira suum]|mgnify:CR=1 FL=1|uniref:type VII toxin-antitoxin system HepT family RNase toxin n=1 Tax=Simplicispira suum TaxID=2109915 RepID=UPI001C6CE1E7|nr:DUF86 domain-containing protein [Simplicispira suum]MBW7832178.1 DUF86 domain-containing protein [Simplicispira suum]